MQYGLISLFPLQITRLFGLVRVIEPVQVFDGRASSWVLVVRGRGFTKVLRDEPLPASSLIRPDGWNTPRPLQFEPPRLSRRLIPLRGLSNEKVS